MPVRLTDDAAGPGGTDDTAASVHWLTTRAPIRPTATHRRRVWVVIAIGFVLLWLTTALVALL
jgi:hypothetical protein